jgi:hypothetical protein
MLNAKLCAVGHILEIVFGNVAGVLFSHPEFNVTCILVTISKVIV